LVIGYGATVMLPTMRIWVLPLLWLVPMCIICIIAFGEGDFWEFPSANWLLIALTCVVRVLNGYWEAMLWQYVAFKYNEAEAVALFVGLGILVLGSVSGVVSSCEFFVGGSFPSSS